MPDPTRPVAGAPIDTDWGQQIHDRVFTPKGTRVAGGAASSISAVTPSVAQLQLNTAVDDPGGWLSSDTLTVPVGGAGLYQIFLDVQTDNGSVDDRTYVELRRNGSKAKGFFIEQNGSTAETDDRAFFVSLAAGDTLNVHAGKTGGLNPDVLVRSLDVIIVASDIGA